MKSIINTICHLHLLDLSLYFSQCPLPSLPSNQAGLLTELEKPSLASAKQAN